MDSKEYELYQEELRAELIKLNSEVSGLKDLTQKQIDAYVAPKEEIAVKGEVIVNTEKEVSVSNLEAVKTYLSEFSDKITTAIEKHATKPVNVVSVDNLAEAKAEAVKISNFRELQAEFKRVIKAISDLPAPVVNVTKQDVVFPKLPSEAIPVRLSDGKSFYNAITTALSSAMASYIDVNNKGVPVRLTAKGSVPVNVDNSSATDVFNQAIIGTRNNQLELDFSGVDPDDISILTVTKTNGGDASTAGGQAVFSTSTNTNGEIRAITTRTVTYHPHAENYAAFTAIFTAGVTNSFQRIGLYSDSNGFFIGYEGTSFGVTIRSNSTDVTTARNSFNIDTLTGDTDSKYTRNGVPEALDTTKDNLYRIRYGWLGAAPIYFEILSPDGEWVTFHTIKHPNTVAVPTIEEPNQPLRLHIKKTTAGATNLIMRTACWAAGTTSDLAKITSTLYDESLAKTVRAVITGVTTGGGGAYVNVKVSPSGAVQIGGEVNASLKQNATIKFASVSVSNSGDNTIVAGVTGVKIKVLSVLLVSNGSVSVKWVSNTTDLTGAMPLVVNSGFVLPASSPAQGHYFETAVGQALKLNLSSAVGVYGHISYYEEA